jgi:hypothetical protein
MILPIDTYQGRKLESTNGCAVISALIVARHLKQKELYSMISDATIKDIIDVECVPILSTLRKQYPDPSGYLALSDVHDHFVLNELLLQENFVSTIAGNVLEPSKFQEFLGMLSDPSSPPTFNLTKERIGKVGATFFFEKHVVSIVKSVDSTTTQPYYDLIDSLPGININGRGKATRTRCVDLESLHIAIVWYVVKKLLNNVDQHRCDDGAIETDPRLFQAFVWSI